MWRLLQAIYEGGWAAVPVGREEGGDSHPTDQVDRGWKQLDTDFFVPMYLAMVKIVHCPFETNL